jgi:hypothetical protein
MGDISNLFVETNRDEPIHISLVQSYAINCEEIDVYSIPDVSDVLILMGHGEGAHLLCKDSVLCSSVCGDCHDTNSNLCRRALNNGYAHRALNDLKGKILILLSCNSLSVAGETYPNHFSLVETALSNFQLVIATPWALEYSDFHLKAALLSSLSSSSVTELLENINKVFGNNQNPNPFVCFGSPHTRIYRDSEFHMQSILLEDSGYFHPSEIAQYEGLIFFGDSYLIRFVDTAVSEHPKELLPPTVPPGFVDYESSRLNQLNYNFSFFKKAL